MIDNADIWVRLLCDAVFIKIPEVTKEVPPSKTGIFKDCKEGFSFFLQHKGLWYLILSMAFMNFFSRLTSENILPAMILARSGGDDNVLGIVSGIVIYRR